MTKRAALLGLLAAACMAAASAAAADLQGAPVVTITPQSDAGPPIEARISKLERMVDGQGLADLLMRVQHLQEDVQRLRGDLEVQANELNGIKQRQRDLYLDIDRRLRQLEISPGAAAPAGSVPAPAAASAAAPTNPEQEQTAYQKAFDLIKGGRYDDAVDAFKDMLAAYPGGKLSDNAHYWMGEAHYAALRYRDAVNEFNKVITAYPQSSKVPDAMLKLAFSYYELGEWAKARASLEQLTAHYPQSTAAQLADKRLQKMKSEGR